MTTTIAEIIECFPTLLQLHRGDATTAVSQPAPPSAPKPGCMLFLNKRPLIDEAVASPAAALVIRAADTDHDALGAASQVLLSSPNPELALALVARTFFPVDVYSRGFDHERVHATAVVSSSAVIADDVIIGPNAVIGAGVRINGGCVIGANTTLEQDVTIGAGTHVHANVFVAHGTSIGSGCEIHPMSALGTEGFGYAHDAGFNHFRHVHYATLVIEDDVHIGACVTIDRGHFVDSVIGRGTKIDDHCHLAHNIRVGENCLMTGGFMASGSVTMGNNNVFGGRSGISDHVTIGNDMVFAALTSVFQDIDEPGKTFGGDHPLQPVNDYLKSSASVRHLPRMRRNLARVMRKLGMDTD